MLDFKAKHEHLDTELNIVPIIDCFVMLICFMLFTAAFTQLMYLEAKLASNTAAAAAQNRTELDQFRMVVNVTDAGFTIKVTGDKAKKAGNIEVPKVNGDFDFATLHLKMIEIKTANPDRFAADIEIKAKNSAAVPYEKILSSIDALRHLTDEEYQHMRISQKQVRNLELTAEETRRAQNIPAPIATLAQVVASNEVANKTDQKVLFPDIAILGLD